MRLVAKSAAAIQFTHGAEFVTAQHRGSVLQPALIETYRLTCGCQTPRMLFGVHPTRYQVVTLRSDAGQTLQINVGGVGVNLPGCDPCPRGAGGFNGGGMSGYGLSGMVVARTCALARMAPATVPWW